MNTPLTIATSLAQPFRTRRTSLALTAASHGPIHADTDTDTEDSHRVWGFRTAGKC